MNKTVLLLGAGKSSIYIMEYLTQQGIRLIVVDRDPDRQPFGEVNPDLLEFVAIDLNHTEELVQLVEKSDLVISMLPAQLHKEVAIICMEYNRNMVTASYVAEDLRQLDDAVRRKGLLFVKEVGLDPGIDHMTAMRTMDGLRKEGNRIILFESFTGGLAAPRAANNLWHYKFTWNPWNVVMAGQGGTARFLQEGRNKYIPYHKLFRRTEFLDIPGYGKFEGYANRDSIKYREVYGLGDALTLFRGTIRRVGFSKAWNMLIQLGLTDHSFTIENTDQLSFRDYLNLFLPYSPNDSVELKVRHYLKIDQDDSTWEKLVELGLFDHHQYFPMKSGTPAELLLHILKQVWVLGEDETDMIVMYHKFGFEKAGLKRQIDSYMVVEGKDHSHTAMALTVGLPVALTAERMLRNSIPLKGIHIPTSQELYEPIVPKLEEFGIRFHEVEVPYLGYNPQNVGI